MSNPQRVSAGVPTGGQFAATAHADNGTTLATPAPAPISRGKGRWEITDTVSETVEGVGIDARFNRTTFHRGGRAEQRVRGNAAAALIADTDEETTQNKLRALCQAGKPMTVLTVDRTGSATATEGRGITLPNGDLALLSKGSKTKGLMIGESFQPLVVAPGYGKQEVMAEVFHARAAQVPATAPADFDGLPDHDAACRASADYLEPPSAIGAAYLIEHPGFGGGRVEGCMFLATDYDADNDIVNGYFWAPGNSELTSEHGSMTGEDMKRRGGRITNYEKDSLSFGDCLNDAIPPSRTEAYRAVTGQSFYPE